jgi:hypothetical protein
MKKHIITILALIALVTTGFTAEMTPNQAAEVLGKASVATHNPAFSKAANSLKGGVTLSSSDQKVLSEKLSEVGSKNTALSDALRLVLSNNPSTVQKTGGSKSAIIPVTVNLVPDTVSASGLDALGEGSSAKEVKITLVQLNRAISVISQQVENAGTKYGIQESSLGEADRRKGDQQTLLKSAEAALMALQDKPVVGDKSAMAGVLLFSAARAETDAKKLSGPNKAAALKVSGAYQVAAAALEGILVVTDRVAPAVASPVAPVVPQVAPPTAPEVEKKPTSAATPEEGTRI